MKKEQSSGELVSSRVRTFLLDMIHDNFQKIVGKSLTIVDAISENETRRKAIHDLLEQTIWSQHQDLRNEVFYVTNCIAKNLGEKWNDNQESTLCRPDFLNN